MSMASAETTFWTDERSRRVEKMWAEGYSFGYIGQRVGATRSTIAGYIRRHGLNRFKQPARTRQRPPMLALPAPPKLLALPAPPATVIYLSTPAQAASKVRDWIDLRPAQMRSRADPQPRPAPKRKPMHNRYVARPDLWGSAWREHFDAELRRLREEYSWKIGDKILADENVWFFVMGERCFERYPDVVTITDIKYKGHLHLEAEGGKFTTWVAEQEYEYLQRVDGQGA